jgi:hypothetical protein
MKTNHRSDRDHRVAMLTRSAALVALCAGALPTIALAQQIDAGQLEIRNGGARVGVENFRVWEAGANLKSVARIEPSGNSDGDFDVGIDLDGQFRPVQYLLRGPGARGIEGSWSVDRVRLHMITEEGERWREIATRGPSSVLEDGVAHHHLLLVRLLRQTGGTASLIVPLRAETVEASLVTEEPAEVSLDGRDIAATRYDIRVGSGTRHVWIDTEGRLLRVVDASSGLEAVRLPPR